MISIIIPSYNRNLELTTCLKSLRDNSMFENEIIVLSPNLNEELQGICNRYRAQLHMDHSRSKGKRAIGLWQIVNEGIRISSSDFACWLNDDCIVNVGWDKTALSYFTDEVGIVILCAKGINQNSNYQILGGYYSFPCANYAILRKDSGIRFDEKYHWFFGDADIVLQIAAYTSLRSVGTKEGLVIHKHHRDKNRQENETDSRVRHDSIYFYRKWKNQKRIEDRLYPMKLSEIASKKYDALRKFLTYKAHKVISKRTPR